MRLIGAPDRPPFAPAEALATNAAWLTLLFCIEWFSNVMSAPPLITLLPLLVIRLMNTPDDCTETSPPPVTTWISWNESKLKYTGDELDDMSVMLPPSRFHCTLLDVPNALTVNC